MGWLDVLIGGVGTGIGGLGQALAAQREKMTDRVLEQRRFEDEQRLKRELADPTVLIDPAQVPATFRPLMISLGQPTVTGAIRVPRGLLPNFMAAAEKEAERTRLTEAGERAAQGILAAGTRQPVPSMVDPDIAPAGEPVVDPRAQQLAEIAKVAAVNPALGSVLERSYKEFRAPEKFVITGPGQVATGVETGRVIQGPPAEPKLSQETRPIGGTQYRITYNSAGQEVGRVPLGPAEPNQGQRNEARAAEILKARGIKEGTPAWDEGMYILTNPTPTVPDVGVFSRLDVLGRGAAPTPGTTGPGQSTSAPGQGPLPRIPAPAKPVPGETTMQIIGVGRLQDAVKKIDAALADPEAKPYFGPYAQYLALAQEKAPYELLGRVPASVIDLTQNLATVQNYTIRLITGAQMNINEETRIKRELPQLGHPEYMFRRLWDTTRSNIDMLEKRVVGLALSGNQQAKAIALELGLMPKESGKAAGAPTPTHRWNPATNRLEPVK